jgi:hypothetical protein
MMNTLAELKKKVVIGCVGGSDFAKISEQFTIAEKPSKTKILGFYIVITHKLTNCID